MIKRLFAPEIVWFGIVLGICFIVADHYNNYWVYAQGMPSKCVQCGLNHDGPCPTR